MNQFAFFNNPFLEITLCKLLCFCPSPQLHLPRRGSERKERKGELDGAGTITPAVGGRAVHLGLLEVRVAPRICPGCNGQASLLFRPSSRDWIFMTDTSKPAPNPVKTNESQGTDSPGCAETPFNFWWIQLPWLPLAWILLPELGLICLILFHWWLCHHHLSFPIKVLNYV